MKKKSLTPEPPRTFVPGPSLSPSGALLEWLGAAGRQWLRLPVMIRFEDAYRLRIAP